MRTNEKSNALPSLLACGGVLLASSVQSEESAIQLPEMTVQSETIESSQNLKLDAALVAPASTDAAELLRHVPGANVNRNGPLTGIPQYRGMYGDRINVNIDGMGITSGGPNAMDTPLHYAPRPLLDSVEVVRGIAPVSAGLETIGGVVRAKTITSRFNDSETLTPGLDLNLGGTTVNDGWSIGALGSLANRNHRLHLLGSYEDGDDTEAGDGVTIFPTSYERSFYGAGYGFRQGPHEVALDFKRNETDKAGTPALPMDIVYVNTSMGNVEYDGELGEYGIHAQFNAMDVDHKMTNFDMREPPNPMRTRQALTSSDGKEWRFDVGLPVKLGDLLVGTDGHLASHDAEVSDPNNPMFYVDNFNDVSRDLYGFFADWNYALSDSWEMQLGGRYNRVNANAGKVSTSMSGMSVDNLANAFNSADRKQTDDNVDLVAQFQYLIQPGLNMQLGFGRKTRSPSYQERYLWLPLESTGGLADGNLYIGTIDLDPEVSNQAELGLSWNRSGAYLTPRVFYRHVDDYIQGTPTTNQDAINVARMMTGNPDAVPLQFTNVDAKLYGFDGEFGYRFSRNWRLDGLFSYVRGKRRDIDDNLYRIAPPNATLGASYDAAKWSVTAQGVFYARQDKVSTTNNEQETAGYGIMNLFGQYRFAKETLLLGGVDNVFDRFYANHLSGYNRVVNSDLDVGERIPGPGRNFYLRLSHRF